MIKKPNPYDYNDPFTAGQMVGMLVVLTFIEQNNGIDAEALEKLKEVAATNAQTFLQKPTEDIYLMINDLVKEVNKI